MYKELVERSPCILEIEIRSEVATDLNEQSPCQSKRGTLRNTH